MFKDIKTFVNEQLLLLKEEVKTFDRKPKLTILKNNSNPASESYVKGKLKDSEYIGIDATLINTSDIKEAIINDNSDGLILQLPCDNFDSSYLDLIDKTKDVDGFKVDSLFKPCTPLGIIKYLDANNFEYEGKNAVVIGRSNIVGKPIANMLLDKNMNVTILHSKTQPVDKYNYIKEADLIIVATGKINTLNSSFIYKKDCVIVDVGINRDTQGKLIGDCERNLPVKFQTPVPGGVGLLTRLALMSNVVESYKNKLKS